MEQVRVGVRVDDFGELTLCTVRHVVLASAAKLVHDLLPIDLHVGFLSLGLGLLDPDCLIGRHN